MPRHGQVIFGVLPSCFDPLTLTHRSFGTVWIDEGGHPVVFAYWFRDDEAELNQLAEENWDFRRQASGSSDLMRIYRAVRRQQAELDWNTSWRSPLMTVWKRPWIGVKPGWYVIMSEDTYPTYVSAVRRTRFTVWSEHTGVCETEADLRVFVDRVNSAHDVSLTLIDGVSGFDGLHGRRTETTARVELPVDS